MNTVRDFLKCRTVGICMAHNRLLSFRVVRSTRPVQYTPTAFIPAREHRTPRDPGHVQRVPGYPDPTFYLNYVGKYFFRHPDLRHLRLEQFNRYFALVGDREAVDGPTIENTIQEDDDQVIREPAHRHYDSFAENVSPGTIFSVGCGIDGARRRQQTRLAVSRTPFIEPLADKRESYFEQKLLLGLPWFCNSLPEAPEDGAIIWKFHWAPPASTRLTPIELALGSVSFEEKCSEIEAEFCRAEHNLICQCCAGELRSKVCDACKYAVGFHRCFHDPEHMRWRKGTLHGGLLDAQRVLFNLHRRGLPLDTLHTKADEYIAQNLMTMADADVMIRAIEQERGVYRLGNVIDGVDGDEGNKSRISHKMSPAELVKLLADREEKLQNSTDGGITDQWRVYQDIIDCLIKGRLLRLMVQASAGTGKSFLMTTIMLWCIVNGKKAKAAAPTGIAASNVEIEGTDVKATTLHSMFDLDTDFVTKLDFAKMDSNKVKALIELEVFLLDEVSMIDVDAWTAMVELLSIADHSRRPDQRVSDAFGNIHVLIFGDFKQLPPATSKPPFIVLPTVYEQFAFRVLRQNRRVIGDENRTEELENFHGVLTDISWGKMSERVKAFVVEAYVRGAGIGCAERAELEGSTSVFTKRRYRDRWNRTIVRRIAKVHNHTLKIKGRCRARGARGKDWLNERRTQYARRKSRTQALWNLHLSGDWHHASETSPALLKPHMMRCMLVNNLAVDMCFVNGTQGRVLHWHPEKAYAKGKAISASHPEILVRFAKESSTKKSELVPDIDHIDVTVRQETLMNVMGLPVLLQVPLVPCYALTVHKTQALSIKHIVRGSLEGVFAQGQVYVLISRCTDPQNFHLVGLPPCDILEDVFVAWMKAGLDPVECSRRCVLVTNEWTYSPEPQNILERFKPRFVKERMVPVVHRTLEENLNPQPQAAAVMHRLLDWIDRVDEASINHKPRPAFTTEQNEPIFPGEGELWWLTDVQRKPETKVDRGDEDGPASEDNVDEVAEETSDEDPMSEDDENPKEDEIEDSLPLERPPRIAWRGRQDACYVGYFERQRGAHCGMHALNNAVGRAWHTMEDMQFACDDYLSSSRMEGLVEVRAEHARPSGWYSSEVMSKAVDTTSMRHAGRVEYKISLEPLHVNPSTLRDCVGAVVNIRNRHWVALRYDAGVTWLLDSQEHGPQVLSEAEYKAFIRKYKNAFPLFAV